MGKTAVPGTAPADQVQVESVGKLTYLAAACAIPRPAPVVQITAGSTTGRGRWSVRAPARMLILAVPGPEYRCLRRCGNRR